jgi:competence protein ComEC
MIAWRLIPFVRIAVVFILGILCERFFKGYVSLFFIFSSIILLFQFYIDSWSKKEHYSYSFYAGGLLMILFFNIGYIRSYFNNPSLNSSHYMHFADEYTKGIGVIQEIPIKRTSYRTEIAMEFLCNDKNECVKVDHKAIIYFKKEDSCASRYLPGDRIIFNSKLTKVNESTNPYSFNFQNYLWNRGITHQTYIRDNGLHNLIDQNNLNLFMQLAMNSRAYFLRIFDKYIKDSDQNSILSAMVLGYRNTVSEDMYKAFSDSGSVHILAVSGMHLVFLAGLLNWLFNKINFKWKLLKFFLTISILWFFSLITGAAPAIIRAAIMFTFLLYGREFKIFYNMYNILAFCALLMLLVDPFLIFQASFQFSFLALLSLAYFQPYINCWFKPKSKILQNIWTYFSATLAAQILVVPITIFFFHKFPTYFILSGFLPVILSNIAMNVSIVLVVIESIPFLGFLNEYLIGPILQLNLFLFIESVTMIKELPMSSIDGLTLSTFEFVLFGLFLILLMLVVFNNNIKIIYLMVILFCFFSGSFINRIHTANHQSLITVYDVNKSGMIDFFDGRTVYNLKFDTINQSQSIFINQNNRFYHFINDTINIDMNYDFHNERIRKVENIIQFKNKFLAIIYNEDQLCKNYSQSDYIILMSNLKYDPCFQMKSGQTLIIDKSVKYNNLKEWKENIEYEDKIIDIRAIGSFSFDI